MLHLELDPKSAVPAYRQLMNQLKYYVASGVLNGGDRLPSIRELARYLGVNPTTVVKTYTELEHEGLIDRLQGKGVFVKQGVGVVSRRERESVLRERARQLAGTGALQVQRPFRLGCLSLPSR